MAEQSAWYGVAVTIRPTGALTFRRMPSAILHISSYPFLPPTTMSGWLRRLFLAVQGQFPATDVKDPDYYVMPISYHVLGAYPTWNIQKRIELHTTARHGVRAFNHNAFSRLAGSRDKKEVYQLHSWEYLLVDRLYGFILHRSAEALEKIQSLRNFGCKCGKEGYAFLEEVSPVRSFVPVVTKTRPNVPASGAELVGKPADLFVIYRHQYSRAQPLNDDPSVLMPSPVDGFSTVWMGWPAAGVELDCLSDGENNIPAGMLEVF